MLLWLAHARKGDRGYSSGTTTHEQSQSADMALCALCTEHSSQHHMNADTKQCIRAACPVYHGELRGRITELQDYRITLPPLIRASGTLLPVRDEDRSEYKRGVAPVSRTHQTLARALQEREWGPSEQPARAWGPDVSDAGEHSHARSMRSEGLAASECDSPPETARRSPCVPAYRARFAQPTLRDAHAKAPPTARAIRSDLTSSRDSPYLARI